METKCQPYQCVTQGDKMKENPTITLTQIIHQVKCGIFPWAAILRQAAEGTSKLPAS